MNNSRPSPVVGEETVLLKLTSGKILSLTDLLHVPEIHWNFISVSLLRKLELRSVLNLIKLQ